MKCVYYKRNGRIQEVKRVQDSKAVELVKQGWDYCSKAVWKREVRDVNKPKGD